MNTFVRFIILVCTVIIFTACNLAGKNDTSSEVLPNIIFILSDDQAWTDYGFMGHPQINTPSIDRLASQGLAFTRGYVPASLCSPSLASIITGLYPHQHSVLGNDPVIPNREKYNYGLDFYLKRAEHYLDIVENFVKLETLPDLLKTKGYVSFQTGKWWLGNYKNGGFDYGMTHGDPARAGRHVDQGLDIGRTGMDTIFNFIDYSVQKNKPFFLWYAPFLPHAPHTPPDSLLDKYLPLVPSKPVAAFWAMCEFFDITCGQLTDYINQKNLNSYTIIVYVCDNGWVQDEQRANCYAEPSKRSPFDTGLRTPIIFKWAGEINPEMDSISLVSSIDLVPTVLEIIGIEPPANLHGINVLDKEKLEDREAIFGEIYAHDFNTVDSSIYYRIGITNPYKLIVSNKMNKPEDNIMLFNIYDDPHETKNLAEEKPEVVKELEERLDEFWQNNQ